MADELNLQDEDAPKPIFCNQHRSQGVQVYKEKGMDHLIPKQSRRAAVAPKKTTETQKKKKPVAKKDGSEKSKKASPSK